VCDRLIDSLHQLILHPRKGILVFDIEKQTSKLAAPERLKKFMQIAWQEAIRGEKGQRRIYANFDDDKNFLPKMLFQSRQSR
jgi:hypothetical protein